MAANIPLFEQHWVLASIFYNRPLPEGEERREISSNLIGVPGKIINHTGLLQEFSYSFTDINDADDEALAHLERLHGAFARATGKDAGLSRPLVPGQKNMQEVTLCENWIEAVPFPKLRQLLTSWTTKEEFKGADIRALMCKATPLSEMSRHGARNAQNFDIRSGSPASKNNPRVSLSALESFLASLHGSSAGTPAIYFELK